MIALQVSKMESREGGQAQDVGVGRGYSQQLRLCQWVEGTHRSEEPVSNITVNS